MIRKQQPDDDEPRHIPPVRPRDLLPDIDLSASDESYVIAQHTVEKRYSELLKAMYDATETSGAVPEVIPEDEYDGDLTIDAEAEAAAYEDFCREVLGSRDDADGKYTIRRDFRTGGMGALYLVQDQDFRRPCVMKVIVPELRDEPMMVRSFVREARITGQLEHPNITPVHDLGYWPGLGLYFTMKLIEGQTLAEILHRLEAGNEACAAEYDIWAMLGIFRKVCDAVSFAHSKGIIHRDIKPRNIMVGTFGEVLLMDWGLAKPLKHGPQTHSWLEETAEGSIRNQTFSEDDFGATTQAGGWIRTIKGSPGYMSPEQAAGFAEDLDERSDIFLLGATLYHMVTYYPPYIGRSVAEVLEKARACEYDSPEHSPMNDAHMPSGLYRIIERCMQAMPNDRYQSVQELIEDLDDLLHGRMDLQYRLFKPGDYLMRQGELGKVFFLIEGGKVEFIWEHDGVEQVIGEAGPGELVGEWSIVTHKDRPASARALEHTRVMVLTAAAFDDHLRKLPTWLAATIQTLSRRVSGDAPYEIPPKS